jgi:hypothetical protein
MNGDDKKLTSHSKHLVAFMVSIVRKWRVTQTLRFGRYPVIRGDALAGAGFDVCTDTLFLSVIHDLAALMFDEGRKTPSLHTCMQILALRGVERRLAEYFVANGESDTSIESQRRAEFDAAILRLREKVPAVLECGNATACRRAREKYVSQFTLIGNGDDYKRLHTQDFGLSLDTPNWLIKRLRPILDDLSLVTQIGSFSWDAYAQQNEQISDQLATGFGGQAGFLPDLEDMVAQLEATRSSTSATRLPSEVSNVVGIPKTNIFKTGHRQANATRSSERALENCPLCGAKASIDLPEWSGGRFHINCADCGKFSTNKITIAELEILRAEGNVRIKELQYSIATAAHPWYITKHQRLGLIVLESGPAREMTKRDKKLRRRGTTTIVGVIRQSNTASQSDDPEDA